LHGIGTDESSDDDSYEENSVPNSSSQVMVIPEYQSIDEQKWEKEAMPSTVRANTRTQRREDLNKATQASESMTQGPS
jgi:hypothetical protein